MGFEDRGHRPAAATRQRLHRSHVDVIDVGALLAVNLDRNEMLVHDGRGLFILKALALHHVAPVAGGIADAEEDGLVLGARRFERLRPPRIPVNRVVSVLKQIGTRLVDQTIGEFVRIRVLLGFMRRSGLLGHVTGGTNGLAGHRCPLFLIHHFSRLRVCRHHGSVDFAAGLFASARPEHQQQRSGNHDRQTHEDPGIHRLMVYPPHQPHQALSRRIESSAPMSHRGGPYRTRWARGYEPSTFSETQWLRAASSAAAIAGSLRCA